MSTHERDTGAESISTAEVGVVDGITKVVVAAFADVNNQNKVDRL